MIEIKKDINSQQIAKLAGVSRSTVSRVINNYPNVPEETRKKVMDIIKKYNYYPNISAQVLAGKSTNTIGLFWISNGAITEDYLSNFFIVSVIENASKFGYLVLTVVISNLSDEKNVNLVKEVFYQGRIDGGIFIGCKNNEPLIEKLVSEGFKIGILDYNPNGISQPNKIIVNFDNDTAERVIDYIVSLNHYNIALIHGDLKRYNGWQKYNGFIKGINKYNINVKEHWQGFTDFSTYAGYNEMKKILDYSSELPTAVCCANDNIAFGAINAIFEKGLTIPDDISIIGIDDHMLSSFIKPSLTTFKVDFSQMLKTLTENLVKAVKNISDDINLYTEYSAFLIERESCRKI